jgi:spoIIIJ-associated protein
MTFREFTGKNVEEAIRAAMREFASDLSDLDIEILAQGSRGILGVGGEEARILAAPKSAVAAAETLRVPEPADVAEGDGEAYGDRTQPPAETAVAPEGMAEGVAAGIDESITEPSPEEQLAELERAESHRPRGGRGRGGSRDRRDGTGESRSRGPGTRERRERAPREAREPREPRADRPAREPAPFIPAKPLEELSESERGVLEEAKGVLEELLRLMDLEGTVEIGMGSETAKLNVKGSDLGVLIGRRGEKLASLQHLVNLIVAKKEGQYNRIAIDVENYRGRREEQLRDVAERAAKRVVQSGKIIQLEPMPAIERRIVHMALVENPRIRTQSVGVEPNRRIVVLPASKIEDKS